MQLEPTALDRAIKPSLVFSGRSLVLVQHRPVEPLDQNAAVLGLVSVGDLEQLARRGLWVGIGARFNKFVHEVVLA
jgi:hypothetical protein